MDAFYAAVEQRDRPELRGQPVIVGGASPRAVVLTASYEARVYGVHSAMPGVHARRLCPQGIFVPPRMRRYPEVARQIRAVFGEFTPLVEPLSLDEAFLDVSKSLRLFGSAHEIGTKVKQRVREVTDLTVSVGIGATKMIAKIAERFVQAGWLVGSAPRADRDVPPSAPRQPPVGRWADDADGAGAHRDHHRRCPGGYTACGSRAALRQARRVAVRSGAWS